MLQGYTMAIVPCGNPTPKKLPTRGREWPTFRTARARRVHSARTAHGTPPIRMFIPMFIFGFFVFFVKKVHDMNECTWCVRVSIHAITHNPDLPTTTHHAG